MAAFEKDIRTNGRNIAIAARCLAFGLTPEALLEQGHPDESTQLSNLLGELLAMELMPFVEQQKEALLLQMHGGEGRPDATTPSTPSRPHHKKKQVPEPPTIPRQLNFYSLVDAVNPTPPLPPEFFSPNAWRDPEAPIAALHRAFQSYDGHERGKILMRDASREWRDFLKEIGAPTWAEKREILTERYNRYIQFLKELGIWDKMVSEGPTNEVLQELKAALQEHKVNLYDPQSSHRSTMARSLWSVLHTIKQD